jgi:hypothetical protein
MTDNLDHLNEDVRPFVEMDEEKRIKYVNRPRWIGHPSAASADRLLLHILNQVAFLRPRNIVLVGAPGSGKTALVDRFIRKHAEIAETKSGIYYPIIKIQMPHEPDEYLFYQNVYEALKVPHTAYELWRRRRRLLAFNAPELLRRSQTRMLVIDDFHSVGVGTERTQVIFLQMLRVLGTKHKIAYAFTGLPRVRSILQLDDQLRGSTREAELPAWRSGPNLEAFTKAFLRTMPLARPSQIDREFVELLAERSEGRIGPIIDELRLATIMAIRTKRDMIDLSVLQAIPGWPEILSSPPYPISGPAEELSAA